MAAILLMAGVKSAQAQVQFNVGAGQTYSSIQAAVNACPSSGCVLTLTDTVYKLSNTVLIYKKSNLTIKGATGIKPVVRFQDKGTLAGPYFTASDSASGYQPAGWKQWPKNNTTAVGG
jgi:hypothetical protein